MEITTEFWETKLLTFHILGTVLGLGGATISDILFFRFLADFRISKKEAEVMNILKNIVLIALVSMLVTGAGLFSLNPESHLASHAFLFKVTVVMIITLNGIGLHLFVAPKLIRFNFEHHQISRYWHKLAFALGSISFVSWYTAFFTAMLKDWLVWNYATLMLIYTSLLIVAIAVGQVIEGQINKKAHEHTK